MNKERNEVENVKLDEMRALKNEVNNQKDSLDNKKEKLIKTKKHKEIIVMKKAKELSTKVKEIKLDKKKAGIAVFSGLALVGLATGVADINNDNGKNTKKPEVVNKKPSNDEKANKVNEDKINQEGINQEETVPEVNNPDVSNKSNVNGSQNVQNYREIPSDGIDGSEAHLGGTVFGSAYEKNSQKNLYNKGEIQDGNNAEKNAEETGDTLVRGDNNNNTNANETNKDEIPSSVSSNQPQPTQEDEDRKQVDLTGEEVNDLISEEPPVKEAEEYER